MVLVTLSIIGIGLLIASYFSDRDSLSSVIPRLIGASIIGGIVGHLIVKVFI